MIRLLSVVLLFMPLVIYAEHAMSYPPVTIAGTELREVQSSNTGRDYHIYVYLPGGYSESDKNYPVLYLLDGERNFKMLASIYRGLRYDMFVPDMILIGIAYGGESPDYGRLRAMDYSPTQVEGMEHTGGGPKFLAFLKDELIPFVEANYRADPADRALGGGSLAGLFVLYTLFHEPDLFYRYISTSPVLGWDDEVTFRYEQAFAEKQKELPVRLFLSVGELEHPRRMVERIKKLARILEDRSYEGLVLTSMVIAGERHAGATPEAFNRGLRAVFAKQAIELPTALLEEYAGTYRIVQEDGQDARTFTVTREGSQLFGQFWMDAGRDELFAATETHFFARVMPIELNFSRNADGEVESAALHMFYGDQVAEKIK